MLVLPLLPQAAQWRQEHRSDAFKQRKLIVWEVDESEPWEGESGKGCARADICFTAGDWQADRVEA